MRAGTVRESVAHDGKMSQTAHAPNLRERPQTRRGYAWPATGKVMQRRVPAQPDRHLQIGHKRHPRFRQVGIEGKAQPGISDYPIAP